MKKKTLYVLPLFALLFALILTGCGGNYGTYAHASRYHAGGGQTQAITSLDVEWVNGAVNITYAQNTAVTFTEESDFGLSDREDLQLHWYVEGATLKIKYAKSGVTLPVELVKTLNVTVPTGTVLNEIDVETVSANVNCQVNARVGDLETVSGNVLTDGTFTSELDLKTVSGDIDYTATALPYKIDAETVSGNIRFTLPLSSSFRVEFESVSGRFTPDAAFAGVQSGKFYTVGGGSTTIDADTVSGNFTITALS